MKAVVLEEERRPEVREVPTPEPGDGQSLVERAGGGDQLRRRAHSPGPLSAGTSAPVRSRARDRRRDRDGRRVLAFVRARRRRLRRAGGRPTRLALRPSGRGVVRGGCRVPAGVSDRLDPAHPAGPGRAAERGCSSPPRPAASAARAVQVARALGADVVGAGRLEREARGGARWARQRSRTRSSTGSTVRRDLRPGRRRALPEASSCSARSARSSGSASRVGRGSRSTRRCSSAATVGGGLLPRSLHEAPARRRPRGRDRALALWVGGRDRPRRSARRSRSRRRTTRSASSRTAARPARSCSSREQQRALVTGGASGIGAALVERLQAEGLRGRVARSRDRLRRGRSAALGRRGAGRDVIYSFIIIIKHDFSNFSRV